MKEISIFPNQIKNLEKIPDDQKPETLDFPHDQNLDQIQNLDSWLTRAVAQAEDLASLDQIQAELTRRIKNLPAEICGKNQVKRFRQRIYDRKRILRTIAQPAPTETKTQPQAPHGCVTKGPQKLQETLPSVGRIAH